MSRGLSQSQRFIVFGLNTLVFYLFYVDIVGRWIPTSGPESIWFGAAVGWWALGLLSAPFFRPPKDALGSGVAVFLGAAAIELRQDSNGFVELLRIFTIAYAILVSSAALTAGILEKRQHAWGARFAYLIAERLSSGAFLFGLLGFVSIFGFFDSPRVVFTLTTLWLLFAIVKPFELLFALTNEWTVQRSVSSSDAVGQILRVDDPNIVRMSIKQAGKWKESVYVACLPDGSQRYVLPLFSHIQDELIIGTGLITDQGPAEKFPHVTGLVFEVADPTLKSTLVGQLCGANDASEIVGFVVEGSHIADIRFEVSVGTGLQEGSVIYCCSENERIFYQVMDARTAEESFQQNPRGTHIVSAAQLGTWNLNKGFLKYPWLPGMNRPVFKVASVAGGETVEAAGEFFLGNVPSTDMKIKGFLPDLMGYHAAILGITGTGKTELVLDLIREALAQKTKVFCVDLTGEYKVRLADLNPEDIGFTPATGSDLESKLFAVETGAYGAGDEKKALKAFIDALKGEARNDIASFLGKGGSGLGIFELAEVANTKASLRATELYLSEIMQWARSHRKARKVLIVLEEAHTIIPETRGAGFDYDTQWVVSRIGQIALQGRKYGVGLLIVSQRTALVSKTILSQCNTFLTHSLIDQTSLDFLGNIYQTHYVSAIPNLRFLQFLAYGKGVRSERPILLERPFDDTKVEASSALDEQIDVDADVFDVPGAVAPPNVGTTALWERDAAPPPPPGEWPEDLL